MELRKKVVYKSFIPKPDAKHKTINNYRGGPLSSFFSFPVVVSTRTADEFAVTYVQLLNRIVYIAENS